MTRRRAWLLAAFPGLIVAAALGVSAVARGLAILIVAAIVGGSLHEVYTGAIITGTGVTWLACTAHGGRVLLRVTSSDEAIGSPA